MTPRLLPALRRGADLWRADPDVEVAEAGERLAAYLEGRAAGRLDDVFGLVPEAGGSCWKTEAARAERDEALRQAARRFGLSATKLAALAARYEATAWPLHRGRPCPGHHLGRVEEWLHKAMTAYPRMPKARHLRSIISGGNSLPD
jgi:hypothetical protein